MPTTIGSFFMDTTNCNVIEAFFNILHQDAALGFNLAQKKSASILAKIPLNSSWMSDKYNAKSTFMEIRLKTILGTFFAKCIM